MTMRVTTRLMRPLTGVRRGWRGVQGALDELFPDVVRQAEREREEQWEPDPPEAYCPRCGASAGPGAVTPRGCAFCLGRSLRWERVTRLGAYCDPLDERIRLMKFHGQWRWAEWIGEQLAAALDRPIDPQCYVVCAVPMHWTRRWYRGFDQSALIAARLARLRGWTCAPLLRRTRRTQPQTSLSPSQRPANVRGSFALREPVDLADYEVLLVDDVKTTGATLRACARLLRDAGAKSVRIAVAAVADPSGQNFKRM